MSYAPFDGVLLDDPRPPIPGALAMLLHLRVARRLGPAEPGLQAVQARAQACQDLLGHGLGPAALRGLARSGLDLGDPGAPHSLANLAAHLEAYLAEVDQAGYLEPDAALWTATTRALRGERGLWLERGPGDGPVRAGLRDLAPARLRTLACVPGLGATFDLAASKGGAASGLFGSGQPLVAWFLDGLEAHGPDLPNDLDLEEPAGWGAAPWAAALDALFEGPLPLEGHQAAFRRGLAEGPVDLVRHGLEQVRAWLDQGLAAREITVVHPEPQRLAAFLEPLLAREGIALHVRGGLVPLIAGAVWSPVWMLLMGVQRLDPCAVSAGLRDSRRPDLRAWADLLAGADQDGGAAFADCFMHLPGWARPGAERTWADLLGWRGESQPAHLWAERLEALIGELRLSADGDELFAPLGLLKEAWGLERWSYAAMLASLRAFLEAARVPSIPRHPDGLRLVAPGTLLDDWDGARATLALDLSEGAWPALPAPSPDLDWPRKAAINRALLEATRAEPAVFPQALQRFRLPRSEHGDQVPRAFQVEAYAFNKLLAMTTEAFVALSPAQDAAGRRKAQGPFWLALEGAGAWTPPAGPATRLRWLWEDGGPADLALARAQAAQARAPEAALEVRAPAPDQVPGTRARWLRGREAVAPTALERLAQCPFRSLAERVWGLATDTPQGRLNQAVGVLAHRVLEEILRPYLGVEGWNLAFLAALEPGEAALDDLRARLEALWTAGREAWLEGLPAIPPEQRPQVARDLEALLPNLAAALVLDARAGGPTKAEIALLWPDLLDMASVGKTRNPPLQSGWTRTLRALEGEVGPVRLDLGEGRALLAAGTLDRLEHWRHEDGRCFLRVTDYKASRKSRLAAYAAEDAPYGAHLQTPLYMLLAEGELPASAALVPLKEEAPEPFTDHLRTLVLEAGTEGWRRRLLARLARYDARLEQGDFPPTPGPHCRVCQLGALCGRPVDLEAEEEGEGDA